MVSTAGTFPFGTRLGLFVIVLSAFLSLIAVSCLLSYALINAVRNRWRQSQTSDRPVWHLLRYPVDYYFLSLLISDLIASIANIFHTRWIIDAGLTSGVYCTTEALMMQFGNTGVALASLAIAGHTFLVLIFRWQAPETPLFPLTFVALIWIFLVLIITVAPAVNKVPAYFGPTTYWCWIVPHYRGQQIGLEYGIFWFVAIVSLLLYLPVFLCLRGNLEVERPFNVDGKRSMSVKWHWDRKKNTILGQNEPKATRVQMRAARKMLAYPIVYIIVVAPISVVRWLEFSGHHVSSAAVCFGGLILALSGLVNVILYLASRPAVLRSLFRGATQRPTTGRTVGPMPEATMLTDDDGNGSAAPYNPAPNAPLSGRNEPRPEPMLRDDDDLSDEDEGSSYHDDAYSRRHAGSGSHGLTGSNHARLEMDRTMAQLPRGAHYAGDKLGYDRRGAQFAEGSRENSWRK